MLLMQKLILIFITTLILSQSIDEQNISVFLVLTLTLTSLDTYYNNRKFKIIYFILTIIFILINNLFIYYLPLFIFDTTNSSKKITIGFIMSYVILLISLTISLNTKVVIGSLSSLMLYVWYLLQDNRIYKQSTMILEDELNELQRKLYLQNQKIIDTQNNEVHLATLNERGRIAREIHDSVGHILTSSILQLGAINMINKDKVLNPLLSQLDESLNEGMMSIRDSIHDIHAQSFDLSYELNRLIESYSFCTVHLNYEISSNTPTKIKYTILSIVKEALNNTAKHSNASFIKVSLRELGGYYQLLIVDNGSLNLTDNKTSGIGLESIKERIEKINGITNFSIDNGFKIHISIPKEN